MLHLIVCLTVLVGIHLTPINTGIRGNEEQIERVCEGGMAGELAETEPPSDDGKPNRPSSKPPQD